MVGTPSLPRLQWQLESCFDGGETSLSALWRSFTSNVVSRPNFVRDPSKSTLHPSQLTPRSIISLVNIIFNEKTLAQSLVAVFQGSLPFTQPKTLGEMHSRALKWSTIARNNINVLETKKKKKKKYSLSLIIRSSDVICGSLQKEAQWSLICKFFTTKWVFPSENGDEWKSSR